MDISYEFVAKDISNTDCYLDIWISEAIGYCGNHRFYFGEPMTSNFTELKQVIQKNSRHTEIRGEGWLRTTDASDEAPVGKISAFRCSVKPVCEEKLRELVPPQIHQLLVKMMGVFSKKN